MDVLKIMRDLSLCVCYLCLRMCVLCCALMFVRDCASSEGLLCERETERERKQKRVRGRRIGRVVI